MTDEALLEAIRRDDPRAFDAFAEQWGRRLMAFGLRMCGQREDAEDVFQETLLKAYRGLRDLREPAALRTWLFRVVANQCLMMRRKENPAREIALDDLKPPGSPDGPPSELRDRAAGPLQTAERSELRRTVTAVLAALPPDTRIVLLLRDLEGLTTAETAEVLGIGLSAVKMRLLRARAAVRARLGADFRELAA